MASTLVSGLDDDAVVAWWELYDSGLTLDEVAVEAKVHIGIVHIALGPEGLDILGNTRLSANDINKNESGRHERLELDDDLVWQGRLGLLSPTDQAIYEALGKLMGETDAVLAKRHLPFAASLPHRYPQNLGKKRYHPMHERQRRMDRLAASKWRKMVKRDMRISGIL